MSAMHPESGVPPEEARNSISREVEQSVNCDELWYSTSRCQPRFDPAAANAMLAEMINLINKGEVTYDCQYLDQVQLAVRYLIQRGLPTGMRLQAGPNNYVGALDPPLTRYNDFLTLIINPPIDNAGAVTIDTNGRGVRQLLRNDGQQMQAKDLRANIPALISYYNGNWYHVGLVLSQVAVCAGTLEYWVRTDGSDVTGDGSANDPTKAFRTIQHAWDAFMARCTSTSQITIRLGVPGTYVGAAIGGFGGNVLLVGDPNNRAGYRLTSIQTGQNIVLANMGTFFPIGVTFQLDNASGAACLSVNGSICWMSACDFDVIVSSSQAAIMSISGTAGIAMTQGTYNIRGNGNTVNTVISCQIGGAFTGCGQGIAHLAASDIHIAAAAYSAGQLSTIYLTNTTVSRGNTTGVQYSIYENSVLFGNNQPGIGDQPGVVASGGQVNGVLP